MPIIPVRLIIVLVSSFAVFVASQTTRAQAFSPLCQGDANGDGIVTFADVTSVLGNWLNDYAPATGPGDANINGLVNFADVTAVLGHWLEMCDVQPVAMASDEPGLAGVVVYLDQNSNESEAPANYRISLGTQDLAQGIITLDMFSIVSELPGPAAAAGFAEPVITSFWTDGKFEANIVEGAFEMPIRMFGTSALVDEAMPPLQEDEGTEDGGLGFTEAYDGLLIGKLVDDPNNLRGMLLDLSVDLQIDPDRNFTNLFSGIKVSHFGPLNPIDLPLTIFCDPDDRCTLRRIAIRPVLFMRNDGTFTGGGRAPVMNAARDIWLKCCIQLVFRSPVIRFVPAGVDIDNVTDPQAISILGVDSDPTALEVIFVGGFNPSTMYGGARVNRVGRGADGRAIFSDACADGSDPGCGINTNVMSHEVGHLFGLCHPGCPACPSATPLKGGGSGYNQGTSGSCMAPSGAAADNPPENSRDNCGNACNALMTVTPIFCCKKTEL